MLIEQVFVRILSEGDVGARAIGPLINAILNLKGN